MQDESSERDAATFSGRAAILFGTQVFGAVVGIVNGILLARLLGPAGKGDYYLLVLVPSTTMVLFQLGLPQAFLYYAARGQTAGVMTKALVLTATLSATGFLGVAVVMPLLREAFLHAIPFELIAIAFIALPLALNSTFSTGVVMGRQAVRWYAIVNTAGPIATAVLLVVVLGGFGPTVIGAIIVNLIYLAIQALGFAIGARRVTAGIADAAPVSYRELFRYGLPVYPGALTQFFSYRADAYLIAFLIADPSEPLGYYSMAVGLAELVFFFPNAISSLFFPHVAGSLRDDSDRQVAMVSRVTLLATGVVAVLLIPAAMLMIWTLLPAFGPSIPPLLVLLPGVVALSSTKVVGAYVAGIGMPAITSYVNVFAFVLNIVANFILIPQFGIVGASLASLVSYSVSSLAFTAIAAHLTKIPLAHFWLPRRSDILFTWSTSVGLLRRVRNAGMARRGPARPN